MEHCGANLVASYEGVTILQTGPRLDQGDLDVWEQCMHLARTGGLPLSYRALFPVFSIDPSSIARQL